MPEQITDRKKCLITNEMSTTLEKTQLQREICSKTTHEELDDNLMKENLLFLLLGFETEHIVLREETIEINPLYTNKHHLYPFKSLAVNIKVIKNFIKKSQFTNDFCKQIFSEYLSSKVQAFQIKAVESFKGELENIYVELHPYANEFKEYAYIIKEFSGIYGLDAYNYFFAKELISKKDNYKVITRVLKLEMDAKVQNWCNNGQISTDFFISESTNNLAFDECFWKDKYKIVQNIPNMYVNDAKKILSIGLMNKIIKMDFSNETDSGKKKLNISEWYDETHKHFKEIILRKLQMEIKSVYEIYFITNYSALINFYDNNADKIFMPLDAVNTNHDQYNFVFEMRMAETRINHFILKVLNVERNQTEVRCNIFENLTISYKPNMFSLFFSPKIYFELELISRFLLQIHNFEYIIVRREKNSFYVLILTFLAYLKSVIYTNIVSKLVIPDTIDMIHAFELFIKNCLRKLYFTNENVFKVFSDIFDLIFECIYCKANYGIMYNSALVLITTLRDELLKQSDDFGLLFYISRLVK